MKIRVENPRLLLFTGICILVCGLVVIFTFALLYYGSKQANTPAETPGHIENKIENYKKPEKNKEKASGPAKVSANILALQAAEDAELKRELDKIMEDIKKRVVSEEAGVKEMDQLLEQYMLKGLSKEDWGEKETRGMLEDIRREFKKLRKTTQETEELVKACRKYKTAAYEVERNLRKMKLLKKEKE